MSDVDPQQQQQQQVEQEAAAPAAAAAVEIQTENAAPAAAAPAAATAAPADTDAVVAQAPAPAEVAAPVVEEFTASPSSSTASVAGSADDDVVELDTASARRVSHPVEPSASDEDLDDQINEDASSGVESEPVADAHERLTAFMAAAMAADPKLAAATNSALEAMGAPSAAAAAAAESATDAEDVLSPRFTRTAEQEAKAKEELQASVQEVQEFLNRQVAAAAAASSASASAGSASSAADAKAARKAAFDAKVAARQAEIRASKGGVRFEDEEEDEDDMEDERMDGRAAGAGAGPDSDLSARLARAAEIARAHNRKLAAEEDEDEDDEQDDEAAPVAQSFLPWLQGKVASKWRGKTATAVRSQLRWAGGAALQLGKTLSWNLLTGAVIALPPLLILNAVETNHLQQQARIMHAVSDEGIRNYIVMGEVPQQRMADHQNIGSMQL